ncbi:MAG: internal scaffolding protein [Microviridae sp.]|nr:MAG: internal scaffolding protein [Microviridae sp.]
MDKNASHAKPHHNPCDSAQSIPRFRSAYGPRYRVSLTCPELPYGRTKQSFKDECDINTILSKFQRTGLLDFVEKRQPQYGDVTGIEFQTALQQVIDANALFADLPSKWRKRFHNDPAEFLDFVDDPANREEAIALGLITPPPVGTTGDNPGPAKGPSEASERPPTDGSKPAK